MYQPVATEDRDILPGSFSRPQTSPNPLSLASSFFWACCLFTLGVAGGAVLAHLFISVDDDGRTVIVPPALSDLQNRNRPSPTTTPSFYINPSRDPSGTPAHTPDPSQSTSASKLPPRTNTPSNSGIVEPSPSPKPQFPQQSPVPIWYDNQLWWDGTYETYPKPLPANASKPKPEAVGKYAYATMITGHGGDFEQYTCLGLAWLASLKASSPSPDIDIVIALLIDDGDNRYDRKPKPKPGAQEKTTAVEVLGQRVYDVYIKAGVSKFVIWRELPTEGKHMAGSWKQAWSKLQMWTLTDYEKVLFMDSDTLVLRNLDHLFAYPEFTAASTWDCANALAPLKPSGGFWLLQPSDYTFGLMVAYMNGRDPCGHTWRMGDMTMTRVLFMDLQVLADPDKSQWQRFDGDFDKWGRCREAHLYPSRIDILEPSVSYTLPTGPMSPNDRWTQLNQSYDILVGPCGEPNFYAGRKRTTDDRYKFINGDGASTWGRPDAFSVHFSCGMRKPNCRVEANDDLPPCQRAMFKKWYEFLHVFYHPEAEQSSQ